MASLTREQIIALRAALPRRAVDVPDFGTVLIRTLTLREVREIQRLQKKFEGEPLLIFPDLLRKACVDEEGIPLFVAADDDLIDSLSWPVADALATAILRLNKMGVEDDDPKVAAPSAAPSGSS